LPGEHFIDEQKLFVAAQVYREMCTRFEKRVTNSATALDSKAGVDAFEQIARPASVAA